MEPTPATSPKRRPGSPLGRLGFAVACLGVVGYVVQLFVAHRLFAPWYLPITGTVGVLLLLIALWQRVTIMRVLVLVMLLGLTAGEWLLFAGLAGGGLPAYTGPIAVGQPFPAFATTLADGTQLTQDDLRGERDTVMVFFRGRW